MDSVHSRKFTALKAQDPSISDSMLLNSNNPGKFTGNADVVVAGAGIIGLLYAIRLKHICPHLSISVFEKSSAPVQKIGESTLSSFTRLVVGEILPQDYLLRLFGLKDGLQFYCIDEQGLKVSPGDIGGLDISFQLDRRMSELFFTMWAQGMGVNVYHGIEVSFNLKEPNATPTLATTISRWLSIPRSTNLIPIPELISPSTLSATDQPSLTTGLAKTLHSWLPISRSSNPKSDIAFNTPEISIVDSSGLLLNGPVTTKLVVDATGFARKLTSKYGKKEAFDGWNCDAYWAYFKEKDVPNVEDRLEHWDYPATKHICFPEGWGWFIKLISWHHCPLANLMDLVAYMIDCARNQVPVDDVPCTRELSGMFECPHEFVTSIGWAVRNDTAFPEDINSYGDTEGEQKFNYFQRKYPTIDRLMTGNYELLPKYYGERTFFVRKTMAYRSPVVAGEGWFAIGNSAGFTNPLISPGINAGVSTAWLAAKLTSSILSAPTPSVSKTEMFKSIETYQHYSHDFMVPRLWQMNRYWYNMFRDHRLFQDLIVCYWALGVEALDIHYDMNFGEKDLNWVVGAGGDAFQEFAQEVLKVLAPNPSSELQPVSESNVKVIQEMARQCLKSRAESYPSNKWGKCLRHYGDNLQLVEGKNGRNKGGAFEARKCTECRYWMFGYAKLCPVCGTIPCRSS